MEKNWTPYKSEKEKFKADFPGRVRRECRGLLSDDGTSPGTVLYISKIGFLGKLIYQINVTRIPTEVVRQIVGDSSPEIFLKASLEVELNSVPGRWELKSCESTIFKGYPALEYEIETSLHIKGIMTLVKNTVYNAFVWFWPDHEPKFEKFINSFEILG
jgi:hypothetical protein